MARIVLFLLPIAAGADCSGGSSCGVEAPPESDDIGLLQARSAGGVATVRREAAVMRADDPNFTIVDLGPLASLLGTWEGSLGLSVTPLPSGGGDGNSPGFHLRHHSFNDSITFEPIIAGVANRGVQDAEQLNPDGQEDQFVTGIQYTQTVYSIPGTDAAGPNEPFYKEPELLHKETGQWLFNRIPGIDEGWSVTRMSSIPHGVTLLAMGQNSTESGEEVRAYFEYLKGQMGAGPPNHQTGSYGLLPINIGNLSEFGAQLNGYGKVYDSLMGYGPEHALIDGLGQSYAGMQAIRLDVSTMASPGTGMVILPNVEAQVHPTNFNASFWVETYPDGRQQLQYIQTLLFRFQTAFYDRCLQETPQALDCLIQWPHVLASTLRKVKDYECPPHLVGSGSCGGTMRTSIR